MGPQQRDRTGLWKLVALERLQMALGVGILGVIALRVLGKAEDHTTAIALTIAGMLAMAIFTFAIRVRLGHELLRRDVRGFDLEGVRARERLTQPGGYADRSRRQVERAVPRLAMSGVRIAARRGDGRRGR